MEITEAFICFIAWLSLSIIIGMAGTERRIGFAGAFFLSLLLSPLVGGVATAFSKDKEKEAFRRRVIELLQRKDINYDDI